MTKVATGFDLRNVIDAFNDHDADRVAENYAPDTEVHRSGLDEPIRGRDGFRERARMFLEAFPDFHIEVEREVHEGPSSAGELRITGTQEGELILAPGVRVPPTGRRVDYRIAVFTEANEDGLIARESGIFNAMDILRQLGVRPGELAAHSH